MGDDDRVSKKEVYLLLMKMFSDAETIAWSRLNNFLLFNSVLVVAWVQLWINDWSMWWMLIGVSLTGLLSGVVWGSLGRRITSFRKRYLDEAIALESEVFKDLPQKPAALTKKLRDELPGGWSGTRWVVIVVPYCFAALHLCLGVFVLVIRCGQGYVGA